MFRGSVSRQRVRQLEDLFHAGIAGDLSDGELLDRFLRRGDDVGEAAFAALVDRHGPMVFRVCNQALNDPHAAEDAVQATFLVLARQAGTIRKRPSVSSWLFGVARRAAARIRMEEARRRRYESRFAELSMALISAQQEPPDPDPYPELHAEIERLPEKYRTPIVLCYFEGLTHEQAASRLRWPVGTVKIRLARAREHLRSRLERPGRPPLLLLPAGALRPEYPAALPAHLVDAITQAGCRYATKGIAGGVASPAVLEVTKEVMKSMLMNKLKLAVMVLSGLVLLGFGAVLAAQQATGEGGNGPPGVTTAATDPARATLNLAGSTEASLVSPIRPPLTGRVERVMTSLGARVKKGDPLLELFSSDLAAAKNEYEAASVQHALDRKVVELCSHLPASNPVSKQALVDSKTEEHTSRLRIAGASALLLQMGLTEKEIEHIPLEEGTQRSKMVLRSPIDGVIVRTSAHPGLVCDPKDLLMSIAREDPLWVTASAGEQDLPRLKVGQDLTVTFPYGNRRVKGKVESIDSRVDPKTRKVSFRTSIPNPDHRFKPGLFVRVELETDTRDDRLDKPRGPGEGALEATANDRLNELERKLDRLVSEKAERLTHATILERLDALERKVDQLLDAQKRKSP
jgi:RND family efflux transporter MFP subunit